MLGTKGSVSNLIQCTHSLGQQVVGEGRLPLVDGERVFPHDPPGLPDRCLESQGLLWQENFIQGLSPLAFFVHAVAGREALVEGATSTAQSGAQALKSLYHPGLEATPCGLASKLWNPQ